MGVSYSNLAIFLLTIFILLGLSSQQMFHDYKKGSDEPFLNMKLFI